MNMLFSLWQTRVLGILIRDAAKGLDANLALSLQSVISELPIGDFEPPNPIQQMIAQLLQERMKPPAIQVKEVMRDDSGKFN